MKNNPFTFSSKITEPYTLMNLRVEVTEVSVYRFQEVCFLKQLTKAIWGSSPNTFSGIFCGSI